MTTGQHELLAMPPGAGWFRFDKEFEHQPLADPAGEVVERAVTERQRRPDLNGSHLINAAGTIWTVVDGHARGWVSSELFERVHFWRRNWTLPKPSLSEQGRIVATRGSEAIRLTQVASIAFISELPPWNDDVCLVSNRAGTVCLFETPRGESSPAFYVVPSEKVMNAYQFDWDKVRQITDDEFNRIGVRVVMTLPDGTS
jgi:hypothetical protein